MAESKRLAFKMLDRLISWFFLFIILFSMVGIALVLVGISAIYHFFNPRVMFLASGILSCFFTFYFTKREIEEEEMNRRLGLI